MATAVVVDTMVASAWLSVRPSDRKARWAPLLEPARWVLPFAVVGEMRFGAEMAGWGLRRRARPPSRPSRHRPAGGRGDGRLR